MASDPCTDTRLQAGIDRLELLAHQPVGGGGRAAAAVALQVHAQHTQLAQVGRCDGTTCLEPVGDVRAQSLLTEPAHRLA